ncbi:MAG: DUF4476 domain-containing protein [Bacteroidetes bacterium]|nr:DUF4476 domain-containing protein [Bacteroidota bacterium]MBK8342192.1 DUF4476 domain-containing protein [Bacteroidota bacterium]
MKNGLLKTMFVLLLQMQNVFAAPPHYQNVYPNYGNSTFEIKSQGANYITVSIDGDFFNEPVKKFAVSNMSPGNHFVEIYTDRMQHSGYYTTTQKVRIYSGYVYIKPASLVHGVIDNFGRFFIKSVQDIAIYDNQYYEPYYPDYQQYNQPVTPVCAVTTAMPQPVFDQLLQTLKNQWFDDTRLNVAKQAMANNWFTAEQVARLMREFSFESSKLELAKYAYAHVVDKPNYFVVYDEFWFSSSVDELINYIH